MTPNWSRRSRSNESATADRPGSRRGRGGRSSFSGVEDDDDAIHRNRRRWQGGTTSDAIEGQEWEAGAEKDEEGVAFVVVNMESEGVSIDLQDEM